MGKLKVLESGMQTTIQDAGRSGYRMFGVPVSGVMDNHSYKLANWLVGNPEEAPVIEMTLKGAELEFLTQATIGLTGAEVRASLNEKLISSNTTLNIEAGDILKIGQVKAGCRVYLSVKGEWQIKKILGSYSTCLMASFGGLDGRPLRSGDVLSWEAEVHATEIKQVSQKIRPHYPSRQHIRFIEGPEWNELSTQGKKNIQTMEFKVSTQSNRMGLRLKGNLDLERKGGDMKSAPVIPGMIQVPDDGQPIVLMRDAQSVGGYPRVAKVVDADLWRLGQLWNPVKVKFKKISMEEAIKLSAFQKNLLY